MAAEKQSCIMFVETAVVVQLCIRDQTKGLSHNPQALLLSGECKDFLSQILWRDSSTAIIVVTRLSYSCLSLSVIDSVPLNSLRLSFLFVYLSIREDFER
jgi:hypothetical protein